MVVEEVEEAGTGRLDGIIFGSVSVGQIFDESYAEADGPKEKQPGALAPGCKSEQLGGGVVA